MYEDERKCIKYGNYAYLAIFEVSDGWDYTLYDRRLKVIDDGIYDDTTATIDEVIEILEDEHRLYRLSKEEIDYTEFVKNNKLV